MEREPGASRLENFQPKLEIGKKQVGGHRIDVQGNGHAVRLKRTPGAEELVGRLTGSVHVEFQLGDKSLDG